MTAVSLAELWLPILAEGLATHVLSTLFWTVLPHHRPEWGFLPAGGDVDAALKAHGATPGKQYLLSSGEPDDKDPAKCTGMVILWNHTPNMGKNIVMTLAFFFFAAATIGYLASIALGRESTPMDVFRLTATAGFLTHVLAGIPTIIWFRRKFVMDLLDGVAYALATGAAFMLLWPS